MTNQTNDPTAPAALPVSRRMITVTMHRVELPAQRRYEDVPADHTPTANDADLWNVRRGEQAIFQTVIENRYEFVSRFAHSGSAYYAIDADPAAAENTATWQWTGRTWKQIH